MIVHSKLSPALTPPELSASLDKRTDLKPVGSVTKPVIAAVAVCALSPALPVFKAPAGKVLTTAAPVAVTITETAIVQLPLAGMLAPVNPKTPPAVLTAPPQVFCIFGAAAKAKPAGNVSVTAAPVTMTALPLDSVNVKVTGVLIGAVLALKALLIVGLARIVVGSLAPLFVAAAELSPPPVRLAKFTVELALRLTCTLISIKGQLDPALNPSLRVQLIVAAGKALHAQPAPATAVAVILLGKVSDTVTVPTLLPLPWLVTAKVYVPFVWPWKKSPTWRLTTTKSAEAIFSVAPAPTGLSPALAVVTLPARIVLTRDVGAMPAAVVTSTLITQSLFAAMLAPLRLRLAVPAGASNAPPQLELALGTGALIKPVGYASTTARLVIATALLFCTAISNVATCPKLILVGENFLATTGLARIVVMSSALLLPKAFGDSPPPLMRTVLTSESGASRATVT